MASNLPIDFKCSKTKQINFYHRFHLLIRSCCFPEPTFAVPSIDGSLLSNDITWNIPYRGCDQPGDTYYVDVILNYIASFIFKSNYFLLFIYLIRVFYQSRSTLPPNFTNTFHASMQKYTGKYITFKTLSRLLKGNHKAKHGSTLNHPHQTNQ